MQPNIGASIYIKKISVDFKEDINSNTVILGNFNTPLSTMDRCSRQKINKANSNLKSHTRLDGFNRYLQNISSQNSRIHILLKGTWILKDNHMSGHRVSLKKFRKTEILSTIFSYHNGMKLETNYNVFKNWKVFQHMEAK